MDKSSIKRSWPAIANSYSSPSRLKRHSRQSGKFGLSFLHVGAFRSRQREGVMKAIHWIIAAAALASVQPTPASAGVNDPEVIIIAHAGDAIDDDFGIVDPGVRD